MYKFLASIKFLKKIYKYLIISVLYSFFRVFKINNNVVLLESFLGVSVDANVSEILFELQEQYGDQYKYVWSKRHGKKINFDNCIMVDRFSYKHMYYMATAKYIINNSRMPDFYVKRDGQIYLQTWHGTPLKKLVYDMVDVKVPNMSKEEYYAHFSRDVAKWDYLLSPNTYSTEIFKSAFRYDGEILEYGYPRNKRLYTYTKEEIIDLKNKLGIGLDQQVMLYTPTYREDESSNNGQYTQKVELDFNTLKINNPNAVILLRCHYLIAQAIDVKNNPNVIDVSTYPDINDLYLVSDTLLTDYSSTMFDYSVLNKPIILFAYDLERFESKLRGFYSPYQDIPATNIKNTDELSTILNDLPNYKESHRVEQEVFRNKFVNKNEINSSKLIIETIFRGKNEE